MVAVPATYSPVCVVCGPAARCACPMVEGVVLRVESREHHGPHGAFSAVHVLLRTADGPCMLLLGARFGYLAEYARGRAAEAPEGMHIRAYHLRRGRSGPAEEEAGAVRAWAGQTALPRYLTDAESLVVLEPDWLIDVTALAGTDYCLRQWLADRLAARATSLQQLRGTVVHACFETLCRTGALPDDAPAAPIARLTYDLALLGAGAGALAEATAPHLERLRAWHALFAAGLFDDQEATPCFESTLLCPELGLRGRVDLAIRRGGPDGRSLVSRVVELKTGRYNEAWPDPEFQVRGYYAILASQDRLAPDFRAQVIYTGGEAVAFRHVPCGPEHIQQVVAGRNRAVLALLQGHAPPPPSLAKCRKSSGRRDCLRLSALLGLDHCRGRDLRDAAAGEGDPRDARFYAEQYRLLRLESHATAGALATLWRAGAAAREADGTAIVALAEVARARDADRWRYRLRCRNRSELRAGETVFLSDGDPVRGEVTVATLLQVGADLVELSAREPIAQPRLVDRYESGEARDRTLRGLHAWLRSPDALRALLYGQEQPRLAAPAPIPSAVMPATLNREQVMALDLALRARDYALVQGPPGTGKTFLIAVMVRALVARGERVLLATWTNQALDTLLHALRAQDYHEFVRLGSARSMDPALVPYALIPPLGNEGDVQHRDTETQRGYGDDYEPGQAATAHAWPPMELGAVPVPVIGPHPALAGVVPAMPSAGVGADRGLTPPHLSVPGSKLSALGVICVDRAPVPDAVARKLRETPVLAGTVSALADGRLRPDQAGRDVLILDEAAQLGVAAAVGALRLARRFILVGDDQQLPPVVQSEEAAREGLSLSPFALLRPDAQAAGALVVLKEQYRMHAAIAAWPSEAFYAGALVAHPSVAARTLPRHDGPSGGPVTAAEAPVVVIDAGASAAREAELAARAARALARSGVEAGDIGVVAPFRSIVAAVRRLLEDDPSLAEVTVDTVDRFQGGQREAMIVCLGLEGIGRRGHAFVDDPRRLNVAFTRARAKLVVIGDLARAQSLPTLAGFLHHCAEHGVPTILARTDSTV